MKIELGYINFGDQLNIFNLIKYIDDKKENKRSLNKNGNKEVNTEK
ncbi:hypothetical protein [Clostridium sp. Marseille-Q2269]|nr:hypothetical protein [Clostridium sp. Marseille-Q2269]